MSVLESAFFTAENKRTTKSFLFLSNIIYIYIYINILYKRNIPHHSMEQSETRCLQISREGEHHIWNWCLSDGDRTKSNRHYLHCGDIRPFLFFEDHSIHNRSSEGTQRVNHCGEWRSNEERSSLMVHSSHTHTHTHADDGRSSRHLSIRQWSLASSVMQRTFLAIVSERERVELNRIHTLIDPSSSVLMTKISRASLDSFAIAFFY